MVLFTEHSRCSLLLNQELPLPKVAAEGLRSILLLLWLLVGKMAHLNVQLLLFFIKIDKYYFFFLKLTYWSYQQLYIGLYNFPSLPPFLGMHLEPLDSLFVCTYIYILSFLKGGGILFSF